MKIVPVSLLCLLAASQPSFAFETDWHWVRVEPHDSSASVTWNVEQGVAKNVTITGSKFTADLYPDDLSIHPKAGPIIRLSGTISGNKVVASAIYIGTDADAETYRGDLRIQTPKGAAETDHVTLKGEWGDAFIGLTRSKTPSPQP
jgi:hypothetical protein